MVESRGGHESVMSGIRRFQVVVAGAGIAGLWALRRLLEEGYDAVLVESEAIGSGQTLASQGILHGGVKYGLDGTKREIAGLLRAMPGRWHECMTGAREPSLVDAVVNAPCQHIWAAPSWIARAGATVGVRAMEGEIRKLEPEEWPAALRDGGHRGSVFRLEETVLDVRSVLEALAAPVRDRILRGEVTGFEPAEGGQGFRAIDCGGVRLEADVFVFAAAAGNERAAAALGLPPSTTQRRPLKQVMMRAAAGSDRRLPPLWGHCVTASPKPVFTVTTHRSPDGELLWYLGGGVAEDGADRSDDEAIAGAQAKLRSAFPAMDFGGMEWACLAVDRAEPGAGSRLPDGPAVLEHGRAAIAWPAKLVYGPELAERVVQAVGRRVPPGGVRPVDGLPLPRAEIGRYPWETAAWRRA